MTPVSPLPTLNAVLNGTCFVLLLVGWKLARAGRRDAHRAVMLAALATSAAFLASYLVYHYQVGSVRFPGQGAVRALYLALLLSHTLLAAAIVPLVLVTVLRGLRGRVSAHRAIARYTMPLWIWVSASGVAVYWMLYRLF
jgi:putative membrane protein